MKINELKAGMSIKNISGKITYVSEPRRLLQAGMNTLTAVATMEDETGSIDMLLWNEQTANIKKGDRMLVINGCVSKIGRKLRLTLGSILIGDN